MKIIQIAPAIITSIAEDLENENIEDGLFTFIGALKKLGYDKVISTMYGADIVTVEESKELIKRIKDKNENTLFTSCCPAWINFVKTHKKEILKNISNIISPQMLVSIYAKYYFSNLKKIDIKKIQSHSVMPCLIKPYETNYFCKKLDVKYIDKVFSYREIKEKIKDIRDIKKSNFDSPFEISSKGGRIFGVTGGVVEAVSSYICSKYNIKFNNEIFRENKPFLKVDIDVSKTDLNIEKITLAKVCGIAQINKILEMIKKGEKIHLVEVMFCPLGCISGAGQPLPFNQEKNIKRAQVLRDYAKLIEKSIPSANENLNLKKLYETLNDEQIKDMFHLKRVLND